MTKEIIRLGATTLVINPEHSLYQQQGRYMGPTDLPGMAESHRICFDGKVHLLQRNDFNLLDPANDLRQTIEKSSFFTKR